MKLTHTAGGTPEAPEEIGFGEKINIAREGKEPVAFHETALYLERGSCGVPARYRVELMGLTCGDLSIEQNDDGTWGGEHRTATEAAAEMARWLDEDADVNVEITGWRQPEEVAA